MGQTSWKQPWKPIWPAANSGGRAYAYRWSHLLSSLLFLLCCPPCISTSFPSSSAQNLGSSATQSSLLVVLWKAPWRQENIIQKPYALEDHAHWAELNYSGCFHYISVGLTLPLTPLDLADSPLEVWPGLPVCSHCHHRDICPLLVLGVDRKSVV